MQTRANLRASTKYRYSEKGALSKQRDQAKNGKKRALSYYYSSKGIASYLKRVFNVDYEEWCRVNRVVEGRCTICRKINENNKRLCVDHDHKTGKFRGLLCSRCNKGLGYFEDDLVLLRRAISYLEAGRGHKEVVVPIFD